ncbi:MAG: EamA family transporter [Candidatus Aminicenantes bacterium]|nr:EamA family transporter [Candidatus Aminicenantes bacterium]
MNERGSLLEIHLAVLLFGVAGLFGKWLLISPFVIVLGRVFFASLTLAFILWFSGKTRSLLPGQDTLYFILLGLILSIHWVSFFKSIQISSVAVGLLSFSTYPVFTTFLEPLFTRQRIIKLNVLLSLICFSGVFLIVPRFDLNNSISIGVLWGVFSGLTFSVLTILNRKLTQIHSSLVIAFHQNFYATLFLAPVLLVTSPSLTAKNISLLIALGVICTALSHTLFIKGMTNIKAQTASLIHTLEPVYGIVFAFIFLKEVPSAKTLLGGTVVLFGQILIMCSYIQKKRRISRFL